MGVLIDSSLSWKYQISNTSKKISRALGIMYKLSPKVLKNVYYSLIYSHIIYANEIWGSASKSELDKILILQKRAMRLMTFNDICPTAPGPLIPSDPIFIKLDTRKVMDKAKKVCVVPVTRPTPRRISEIADPKLFLGVALFLWMDIWKFAFNDNSSCL